jgi:exodeoxyribonuclease-1
MAQSFFWYDLETSGISPREQRVMQFAGQRTDMDLNPVGEPVNVLIKLGEDVLPDPDAILITGITPQQTLQDGVSEAEFLEMFYKQIATPGTIFVGFNSVRFDDEFMRFLLYRNFYDAYEWEWSDGRSRWDLLDVVRMARALRPEGIKWPVSEDGKPTNRLELLTAANGVDHQNAHDALGDVRATIAVAKLIRDKQPKLFDWLLSHRGKNDVKKFLEANPAFVYTSGRFDNEVEKTAAVRVLHVDDALGAVVYDLRHDPDEFMGLTPEELAERWRYRKDPDAPKRLPVKTMKYNRCPAISPLGVLKDKGVQERLKVTPEVVQANLAKLSANEDFVANVVKARDLLDEERGESWSREKPAPEAALYAGSFFDDTDKKLMGAVRAAEPAELSEIASGFHDERLRDMLPRYKARNFSSQLTDEERAEWEKYRYHYLMEGGQESRLAKFMHRLGELADTLPGKAANERYLLEELQLYAESIMPQYGLD